MPLLLVLFTDMLDIQAKLSKYFHEVRFDIFQRPKAVWHCLKRKVLRNCHTSSHSFVDVPRLVVRHTIRIRNYRIWRMQNQGSKGYKCEECCISKRLEEGEEVSEFHFHQVAQVLLTKGWTNTNEDGKKRQSLLMMVSLL